MVLTGGSAVMQGMVELGEEIFHMPVRIGIPRYAGALAEVLRTPRATAMGLLYEGVAQRSKASFRARAARSRPFWGACGSGSNATFEVNNTARRKQQCLRS